MAPHATCMYNHGGSIGVTHTTAQSFVDRLNGNNALPLPGQIPASRGVVALFHAKGQDEIELRQIGFDLNGTFNKKNVFDTQWFAEELGVRHACQINPTDTIHKFRSFSHQFDIHGLEYFLEDVTSMDLDHIETKLKLHNASNDAYAISRGAMAHILQNYPGLIPASLSADVAVVSIDTEFASITRPRPAFMPKKKKIPNLTLLTEVGITVHYLKTNIRESFHCLVQDNIDARSTYPDAAKYEKYRFEFLHGPNFPRRRMVVTPNNKQVWIPVASAYLPQRQVASWMNEIIAKAAGPIMPFPATPSWAIPSEPAADMDVEIVAELELNGDAVGVAADHPGPFPAPDLAVAPPVVEVDIQQNDFQLAAADLGPAIEIDPCRHNMHKTRQVFDRHTHTSFCQVRTSDNCPLDEAASMLIVCGNCHLKLCRKCWNKTHPAHQSRTGPGAGDVRIYGREGTVAGERRGMMQRGRENFYAYLLPGAVRAEIELIGQGRQNGFEDLEDEDEVL